MSRWLKLIDAFDLLLPGTNPWDPFKLDSAFPGASHGEKCAIAFLLNVWNSEEEWVCGKFDLIDAYSVWDETRRIAFLSWASDPWWP